MTFEEKLAKLRKNAGYSQEDLADKLNVSRQTIYRWETGNALPDALNLKQISALFNISLDVLLSDDDNLGTLPTSTNESVPDESENSENAEPLPAEKTKMSYGKVNISDIPMTRINVESDNTRLTNKEVNERNKIQYVITGLIIAAFVALVAIVICGVWGPTFSIIISAVLLGLLILAAFIVYFVFYKPIGESRRYFRDKAKEAEDILKEKNYWYVQLQNDILAWFFYDSSKDSFGFYYLDGEQFVCPLQNYISFTCDAWGQGKDQTGTKMTGGAVIGGGGAVYVSRTPTYEEHSNTDYAFSLHYYEQNGDISEYAYKLSSRRAYRSSVYIMDKCAESTRQAFTKICGKLEGEKNKIA